jgi:hypothetical protein
MSRLATAPLAALVLVFTIACEEQGGETPNGGAYLVETGECEGNAYAKDMDTGAAEPMEVRAEADGRDILLYLDNLTANCCPSADATISYDGFDILVEFEDVTTGDPCDCECVMDFVVTMEDFTPGTYSIEVDYRGSIIGAVDVEIEA